MLTILKNAINHLMNEADSSQYNMEQSDASASYNTFLLLKKQGGIVKYQKPQ
jgi:hypothetical protein